MSDNFNFTASKERVEKMQQGRKEKASQKVEVEIDKYIVESYDYGWRIYEKNKPIEKMFYVSLDACIKKLYDMKLKQSGAKNVKEMKQAIKDSHKMIEEFVKKFNSNN